MAVQPRSSAAASLLANIAIAVACAGMLVGISGCRDSGLVRVKGRVTYADGAPVPLGRVIIDAGGKPTGAWGRIKSDGRFTIGTLKENDGVAPGTYRVRIVDASTVSGPDGPGKIFVAPKFSDFATSGLEFRVPEQTDWQIKVEPPEKGR
jgi:hypothetical protein